MLFVYHKTYFLQKLMLLMNTHKEEEEDEDEDDTVSRMETDITDEEMARR